MTGAEATWIDWYQRRLSEFQVQLAISLVAAGYKLTPDGWRVYR